MTINLSIIDSLAHPDVDTIILHLVNVARHDREIVRGCRDWCGCELCEAEHWLLRAEHCLVRHAADVRSAAPAFTVVDLAEEELSLAICPVAMLRGGGDLVSGATDPDEDDEDGDEDDSLIQHDLGGEGRTAGLDLQAELHAAGL